MAWWNALCNGYGLTETQQGCCRKDHWLERDAGPKMWSPSSNPLESYGSNRTGPYIRLFFPSSFLPQWFIEHLLYARHHSSWRCIYGVLSLGRKTYNKQNDLRWWCYEENSDETAWQRIGWAFVIRRSWREARWAETWRSSKSQPQRELPGSKKPGYVRWGQLGGAGGRVEPRGRRKAVGRFCSSFCWEKNHVLASVRPKALLAKICIIMEKLKISPAGRQTEINKVSNRTWNKNTKTHRQGHPAAAKWRTLSLESPSTRPIMRLLCKTALGSWRQQAWEIQHWGFRRALGVTLSGDCNKITTRLASIILNSSQAARWELYTYMGHFMFP